MSHIATVKTELRDPDGIAAACRRLRLEEPKIGTAQVFKVERTGLIVHLPGWVYPVVIDVRTGDLHYDNYDGMWGDLRELDHLKQAYAVEVARKAALANGYSVQERVLPDQSIQLVLNK